MDSSTDAARTHADPWPHAPAANGETPYERLFRRNREWVAERTAADPEFFTRRAGWQAPTFLFVRSSDSRVPAELLAGVQPGEMFVHRNVTNVVAHADLNMLSVLQYAVEALRVQSVLVCGHYGRGGARAAIRLHEDALAAFSSTRSSATGASSS